jgi:hypothetical protein
MTRVSLMNGYLENEAVRNIEHRREGGNRIIGDLLATSHRGERLEKPKGAEPLRCRSRLLDLGKMGIK